MAPGEDWDVCLGDGVSVCIFVCVCVYAYLYACACMHVCVCRSMLVFLPSLAIAAIARIGGLFP